MKDLTVSLILACLVAFTSSYALASDNNVETSSSENKEREPIIALKKANLSLLAKDIEVRISNLKTIAKSIANDTHIKQWIDMKTPSKDEVILLDKLGFYVTEFELTSASYADKASNKYWNHEGFLRTLKPEIDTWYFNYIQSSDSELISIYHDKNKRRVDLYVNHQQLTGNGLSGVATSFESVLLRLKQSSLADYGELFIIDKSGSIQVHSDISFENQKVNIDSILLKTLANHLQGAEAEKVISLTHSFSKHLIATPLMGTNWYLVFLEQ